MGVYHCVQAYLRDGTTPAPGPTRGQTYVDLEGRYELQVAPGEYVVIAWECGSDDGHLTSRHEQEWYADAGDATAARPVAVGSGQRVANIDFSLPGGTYLTGRVLDESGVAVSMACVAVYSTAGEFLGYGLTRDDGRFRAAFAGGGPVQAVAYACGDRNDLRPEWWREQGWRADADPIAIASYGSVDLGDLVLAPAGDADGDGLSDLEEFRRYADTTPEPTPAPTDILDADSDDDGTPDGADVDPLDPSRGTAPSE
jgi:hypothetical protein